MFILQRSALRHGTARRVGSTLLRLTLLAAAAAPLAASGDRTAPPIGSETGAGAGAGQADTSAIEAETLTHFQALIQADTTQREEKAAAYLQQVLEKEGIPVKVLTLEDGHPNVIARLKGSGKKKPLLIMGHTDVVSVDPAKWTHPPFGAERAGGHIYGRGSVDDKDNVVASLMTMIRLKRENVPLDRDVIFLAEAGEEGTTRVGIQFIAQQHFPEIDAEYCLAEGGNVTRMAGKVKFASVQTLEKIPRAIELVATGPSGHGSVPLQSNAVVHLSAAVGAVGKWRAPMHLNETTRVYFNRLSGVSTPEEAARYQALLGTDERKAAAADDYLAANEPRHASMLRTSISPTMITAGYRVNVIPSDAKATLDVRTLPNEDPARFLEQVKQVVNDPTVEVRWAQRDVRPGADNARLDSEAFKAIEAAIKTSYDTVTLPAMSPGATDMAYLRAKGIQCYGIGPALDWEDGPKGFGAHSDQERILEAELHRFVRFNYDVVVKLAGAAGARPSTSPAAAGR